MTSLSRRKHPTTRRGFRARLARKTISAAVLWLAAISGAQAQTVIYPPPSNSEPITPKFVPANGVRMPTSVVPTGATFERPIETVTPTAFAQPLIQPRTPGVVGEGTEIYLRTTIPGPQRLFQRDSESTLFNRIAHDMKSQQSGARAIFPEDAIISKDRFTARLLKPNLAEVEPCYVTHGRLYFEQPNFERAGYDLGVLTPGINLAVFYYDLLLLPYHACSDLRMFYEASAGNSLKCLPGDPSPFLWPCERFSVSGLVGQTGAVVGGIFLFP